MEEAGTILQVRRRHGTYSDRRGEGKEVLSILETDKPPAKSGLVPALTQLGDLVGEPDV